MQYISIYMYIYIHIYTYVQIYTDGACLACMKQRFEDFSAEVVVEQSPTHALEDSQLVGRSTYSIRGF